MTEKNNTQALLFASAVLVLWASVATAFKIALGFLRPFELLFLSTLFSFFALSLIMFTGKRYRRLRHVSGKHLRILILAGVLNPVLYYGILFKAYDMLPAQFAQAVNFTWPLVMALVAMILKQERFHILRLAALCVSFGGVLVLVLGGRNFPGGISMPGILLAFSTTFIWTFYWLRAKSIDVDPVISLWVPFATGAALLSLTAVFFFRPEVLSIEGLAAAAYVGLFEMSITFLLWLNALRRSTSTALVGNFIYAVPFLSLVFIRYILHEPIQPTTLIGLVLISAGIVGQVFIHRGSPGGPR
jgi:drug/metabolite transporter (DMT)-like permease